MFFYFLHESTNDVFPEENSFSTTNSRVIPANLFAEGDWTGFFTLPNATRTAQYDKYGNVTDNATARSLLFNSDPGNPDPGIPAHVLKHAEKKARKLASREKYEQEKEAAKRKGKNQVGHDVKVNTKRLREAQLNNQPFEATGEAIAPGAGESTDIGEKEGEQTLITGDVEDTGDLEDELPAGVTEVIVMPNATNTTGAGPVEPVEVQWILSGSRTKNHTFELHCKGGSPICSYRETIKPDLTHTSGGIACVVIFVIAYALAMMEERFGSSFKKSTPMTFSAGLIWFISALEYSRNDHNIQVVAASARHNLLEFGEVFLFLLVAMTYISTLEELNVFHAVRYWLLDRGFSLKGMFWITGMLSFVISPIADNLTTSMLMGAIVMAVGAADPKYVSFCCINIVVASNAGGAFSPFGDVTTLMVWQKGKLQFGDFAKLMLPSLVNWLIPAFILAGNLKTTAEPHRGTSKRGDTDGTSMHSAAPVVILLFLVTVSMASGFHQFAHLPPVLGMMTGLGMLKLFGFIFISTAKATSGEYSHLPSKSGDTERSKFLHAMDIFKRLEHTEWDTLLFFYGVIMAVGGLGLLGYLDMLAKWAYGGFGATIANVFLGLVSGLVDNIPVMFAVLSVDPVMDDKEWLLVTLTAGVGGSLLSIGSAAGVGLMGTSRGMYTFADHMRWSWAIMLGYIGSVLCHLIINK